MKAGLNIRYLVMARSHCIIGGGDLARMKKLHADLDITEGFKMLAILEA